jgi:hypothetical protein
MKFFTPPARLVLYSYLAPDECARRLTQAIDAAHFSFFSLSGYRGRKPFLGRVSGQEFRVFQRLYGRNAFPPVLSGAFLPGGKGTQIEGSFDLELTSKIAICLLSLFGVLVITPVVLYSIKEPTVPRWLALAFAGIYITGAFLTPRIVRGIGLEQERNITDFLCTVLEVGEDKSAFEIRHES